MPRYALIISDSFVRTAIKKNQPPDIAHKSVVWLPCPTVTPPSFDPETEVREGPTFEIGETEVTETYNVRNRTAQELSNDKDARLAEMNGLNGMKKVIRSLLNMIRANMTPAQPALNQAAVDTWIKDQF